MNDSYFDGGLLQQIGWSLLGFLVAVCTLGMLSMGIMHDLFMGNQTHRNQWKAFEIYR